MAEKKNDKKQSAFKNVDALFDEATPKKEEEKPAPAKDAAEKLAESNVKGASAPQVEGAPQKGDELALAPTEALHGFPNHPYTVDENDNDMAELVESIQREGLLERIVVQRRKEGGFEILSGHRRHRACQTLGLKEVPVLIKHGLSKDQAILLMVDANLKRKNILPMDEARALKMQMDAMNRMGKRDPNGKLKRTDEAIAEKINKNRMYVQRKVKLLDLTPELQEAVNDKTLSETPAFEIAVLPKEVQKLFYDWMTFEDRAPTVAQAIALRQHQTELTKNTAKGGKAGELLDEDQIDRIMSGERLAEIFPPPAPEKVEPAQAEQKDVAGPQPPDAPAVAAAMDGHEPAQGGQSESVPESGASAGTKAIPFQTPNTQAPEPGRSSYNSSAPAPEPPQQASPPQQAQPAVDATKAYIRTEYMAELRKENVILPKAEIKELVPGCSSNIEYVIAIKKALTEIQAVKQGEKAVEEKPAVASTSKLTTPLNTVSSPATEIINRAEAREAAEKAAAKANPTKAPEPSPAAKPPAGPAKAPKPAPAAKPPASPAKAPEPAPAAKPPAGPAKAPEPSPVAKPSASPAKAPEPAPAAKPPASPAKAPEPLKAGLGIKALDDFLKNKPRPGKGKGPQDKMPGKTK